MEIHRFGPLISKETDEEVSLPMAAAAHDRAIVRRHKTAQT